MRTRSSLAVLAVLLAAAPARSSAALQPLVAPAPAGPAAVPGPSEQQLYVHDFVGNVYRVDDYATAPTALAVAQTGVGRTSDIAFDLEGRMLSCSFGPYPTTRFHTYDASFQPTLVATNASMAWANALDVGADGTVWVRSANTPELWTMDAATWTETLVATMFAPTAGDLAVDRVGNVIALDAFGGVDRYEPATGTMTILGSHGLGATWGIEIDRDGTVYVCTSVGDLYTLDLATMATAFVGSLGVAVGGCAFLLPADSGDVGQGYCEPTVVNSTGSAGSLVARGSAAIADDDLTFSVAGLPSGTTAFVLSSSAQGFLANPHGSLGTLCLGGTLTGLAIAVAPAGTGELALDLASIAVKPGETRYFQCWYRDWNPTSNAGFTNALSLDFH